MPNADHSSFPELTDLGFVVAKFCEYRLSVLAQFARGPDLSRSFGKSDRDAVLQIFAVPRVIDLHHEAHLPDNPVVT